MLCHRSITDFPTILATYLAITIISQCRVRTSLIHINNLCAAQLLKITIYHVPHSQIIHQAHFNGRNRGCSFVLPASDEMFISYLMRCIQSILHMCDAATQKVLLHCHVSFRCLICYWICTSLNVCVRADGEVNCIQRNNNKFREWLMDMFADSLNNLNKWVSISQRPWEDRNGMDSNSDHCSKWEWEWAYHLCMYRWEAHKY